MTKCDNCGSYSRCRCTYTEQIAAARIKERARRKALEKAGRPVLVDLQRRRWPNA